MAERRVAFITSNGAGLGHLTRTMAAARRLGDGTEAVFITMSRAAPTVAALGFDVEYLPSAATPGAGSGWRWNLRLRRRLEQLLDDLAPDLVVFDGVHPYRGLTHVLTARPQLTSVWCRRPMWREDADTAALARSRAFTLVIEPGELAAAADRSPRPRHDAEVFRLPPVLLCRDRELLDRAEASRELGLDPERPAALVALGQGPGLDQAASAAIDRLRATGGLQIAVLESALAEPAERPADVVALRGVFPIAKYMHAFDFGVVAAGYNVFHETLAARLPAVFVPMERETDDQAGRASWAAQQGFGLAAAGPLDPSLPDLVASLAEPATRAPLERALSRLEIADGAGRMALELEALARGRSGGAEPGGLERWLRLSAHPIGPSLPWAGIVTARELWRAPARRRPRLGIAAFGLEAGELAAACARAAGEAGIEPSRSLAITDAVAFAEAAAAGFGVERLPDAAQARRLYPRLEYGELVARRLRIALAGRRPRHWVSAPGAANPPQISSRYAGSDG